MRKDKNKIRIDSFVMPPSPKPTRAMEMAEEQKSIEEYKIKPHVVPLTTVVAAYCTSGDTREAERVLALNDGKLQRQSKRTHVFPRHLPTANADVARGDRSWMVDLGFRIDCGDTMALVRATRAAGRNAVQNMIQDVANQDAIVNAARKTETNDLRTH